MTARSHAPYAAQPTDHPLDRTLVAAFLENVPDAVYFKNRDGEFIAVSRSKADRHGLAPEDMVGKTDRDFFSEEHAARAAAEQAEVMSTGEPIVRKRERTLWRDGRESWAEATKLPLRDMDGSVIGIIGITDDITQNERLKTDLDQTQRNLLEASRTAGMAEVATGVLHNVGNALTSLNVSANVIATTLQQSKAPSLLKLSDLLAEHAHDLGAFVAHDPKGRRVPEFLESLARHASDERDLLFRELTSLQQNIDHIKEVVAMQQACATIAGSIEPLEPAALMEDAVRINGAALARHEVNVVREFQPVPRVLAERAKVLQILVNLIGNAKSALDETPSGDKRLVLRIAPGADGTVLLSVEDNGIGIPPENLPRIFTHGFTTRPKGHGFGLHSSGSLAKTMQGTLTARSEGAGLGATFTLELRAAPPAAGDRSSA